MDREIEQAFSEALGIETDDDSNVEELADNFFEEVKQEQEKAKVSKPPDAVQTAPSEETPKFVHEPTGKEFASELELLRYESGWKNEKFGKENKELREKLASLEQRMQEPRQPAQVPGRDEIKKQIWRNRSEEDLKDPIADFVLDGLDSAVTMMQNATQQQVQALQREIASLKGQLEETSARSGYGIDAQTEQSILEKHPSLKALSPKERVAVIADLARASKEAQDVQARKLTAQVPQPRAEDHVEGSAVSSLPDEGDEAALGRQFDKYSPEDQLSVLRGLVKRQGSFGGYNPWD